ncbi:Transposable element Tcb1 transposase, partial [Stegodyphus mimosarum]
MNQGATKSVSQSTIQRTLLRLGLRSRRLVRAPMLTAVHRRRRLEFARQYSSWTSTEWRQVAFSDESRFMLHRTDGRWRIRRETSERNHPATIAGTVQAGGGSIMVWGMFSWHSLGSLIIVEGTMDQYKYASVLADHVHPYMRIVFPQDDGIFQQDNARCHTAASLSSATGTTISRQTVYRRLGQIGLYARRPVRCVPLTATHCRLRLACGREHALWTPQQWARVMFSEESRFSLQSYSRRTLIWRAPGTRYHQENIIERHRYGGAGVLVWGGIILGSRTDVHVQIGTMTSQIYRDVVLEQYVRLFRGAMDAQFVFMDDNARPHRANIVNECIQSEDITRMDWPAFSPDWNPVEHVWDMLGRRVAARLPPPTCLPELRRALLFEWYHIPQDQIDNLILSMPRRCTDCIVSSG